MYKWENDTHKALDEVDWDPYWSINDTLSNTQAVLWTRKKITPT